MSLLRKRISQPILGMRSQKWGRTRQCNCKMYWIGRSNGQCFNHTISTMAPEYFLFSAVQYFGLKNAIIFPFIIRMIDRSKCRIFHYQWLKPTGFYWNQIKISNDKKTTFHFVFLRKKWIGFVLFCSLSQSDDKKKKEKTNGVNLNWSDWLRIQSSDSNQCDGVRSDIT